MYMASGFFMSVTEFVLESVYLKLKEHQCLRN